MLVHHADARRDRIVRAVELNAAAVHQDLAGIGLVEAVHDVHQRGFARAVFAD